MLKKRVMIFFVLGSLFFVNLGSNANDEPLRNIIENYEKYIGRDLVNHNRAINANIIRTLPLSCPPFHLRDKEGNIIDPTKNPDGTPVDPNLPVQQQGISRPVSTKQTCGACHPYERITHGYHFQMGRDEMYPEGDPSYGIAVDKSPGFFGKWLSLYQRELVGKHFDDTEIVDMTPFDWVINCGICHPGGGPAEYDREGKRYDITKKTSPLKGTFGEGDYYNSPWEKTGVIEADCFICHLENYEYSLRAQQIKKWNFEYASTAGAGLGYVWGSTIDGQQPKVYYDKSIFRADGTVHLPIRRPTDRQCMFCHDMSSVQKRGISWHSPYMQDVHTEQGLKCIDCHHGDIRHNFAKGSSSVQTVRDDLDNTALSCSQCHDTQEKGATYAEHRGLPPLHLERIACTACHITHRPFLPVSVIDPLTGKTLTLPEEFDSSYWDAYEFGGFWGWVRHRDDANIITPFSKEQLTQAKEFTIKSGDNIRTLFKKVFGKDLPEGDIRVADFVKDKGGLDNSEARALMLIVLSTLFRPAKEFYPLVVYRGQTYSYDLGQIRELPTTLQPKRPGATIKETKFALGRSKGDGKIYAQHSQVSAYWVYMDGEEVRPVLIKDMRKAFEWLTFPEYSFVLYPAKPESGESSPALPPNPFEKRSDNATGNAQGNTEPLQTQLPKPGLPEIDLKQKIEVENELKSAVQQKIGVYRTTETKLLKIHDDNNDTFPEVNTLEEIGLFAWALKQNVSYLKDKDEIYYIRGTKVFKVKVTGGDNPYAKEFYEMERIGENQPFIAITRYEESEEEGQFSWDKPNKVWKPVEVRLCSPYNAEIEKINPESYPSLLAFAKPLEWTVSHGVEPVSMAKGAKGCTECHSLNSDFFMGSVLVDPFTENAVPEYLPMWAILGYDYNSLKLSAWREGVLKRYAPWIILAQLVVILLHYILIGRKEGTPVGKPNVIRFRGIERISHGIAMVTVTFLAITGFFFLLGQYDPLGPWARVWHTCFGYVACVGVLMMFLCWVAFMFPAKGDLKWLLKAGGYLGGVKGHVPAGKFNAGQKILFWLAMLAFGTCGFTGVVMGLNRGAHFPGQELYYTLHDISALVMIMVLIAHVYLAAFVVPHSLRAIFGGKVSDIWAKEHHSLWAFTVIEETEKH
ncbi:MAG: formate dehydrogenase subunit gamma [Candidatus Hydrogenedentes bacterium]|nr:formate dehydrogenase subunit gamma [Candidatus Hydrogenedentota bacterium]